MRTAARGRRPAHQGRVRAAKTAPLPLAGAARWPLGVGLTAWRYMWRTTPTHRREVPGSPPSDASPPLPGGVDLDGIQRAEDGVGDLFHRRYRTRIRDARLAPEELVGRVAADLDRVAPTELASFSKTHGEEGRLRVGDEYVVRIPGPWDGPVRVVEVTSTSFRFATLEGHLEAGQIEFRSSSDGDLLFGIESWARSGDRLSDLLYERLRMSKEVQLHMWCSLLERVAELSGGRMTGGIDVDTRRVEENGGEGADPPRDPAALEDLRHRRVNFSLDRDEATPENGWQIDAYRQPLPAEPPGPPVGGGSWEAACRIVREYDLADPSIVRASYRPEEPLEHRDMLLELRFYGLRFHVGVRVVGVHDATREAAGRRARMWGWSYRTLEGHLEMGQMDYEVWKWLDSGEVEFRVSAFSRWAHVDNPAVRLGLRIFGRGQQVRFARRALRARGAADRGRGRGRGGRRGGRRVAVLCTVASSCPRASGHSPAELPRAPPRAPHTAALDHRSVLDDGALLDRKAAVQAVGLRPQRVGLVVGRDDDVVELPQRGVVLHPRDRVVDVVLPLDSLGLPRRLAALVELHRVDDLVLLRDLVVARHAIVVELELDLAGLDRVDDLAVEPHALDLEPVGVAVDEVLDAVLAERRPAGQGGRRPVLDPPDALFRLLVGGPVTTVRHLASLCTASRSSRRC
ncbi:MAG: DUF1990 domain-containing protein [Actinomycetota bacterium]|nr:DUF1990 domain-containing protein [Actinomycetota bacterium]